MNLLVTIYSALLTLVLADYATITKPSGENVTLITNLDDNQICYLHMYGLRINARRPQHPYTYGYRPNSSSPALYLVTTSDSNITLAGAKEFVDATRSSDHSPVYDKLVDYCDIARSFIDQYRIQNEHF